MASPAAGSNFAPQRISLRACLEDVAQAQNLFGPSSAGRTTSATDAACIGRADGGRSVGTGPWSALALAMAGYGSNLFQIGMP